MSTSRGLIDALGADTLTERDHAGAALVALGPAVAAELLSGTREQTPGVRARRIYTFAGIHLRHACETLGNPEQRFDLRFTGTLTDALAAVCQAAGAHLPLDQIEVTSDTPPIDLDLRGVTLLEALDRACTATGYQWTQDVWGALELERDPGPAPPSAYHRTASLHVTRLSTQRVTDFQHTSASANLTLYLRWLWPHAPLTPPAVYVRRLLTPQAASATARNLECSVTVNSDHDSSIAVPQLPAEARRLEDLSVEVVAAFPSAYRELALDDLRDGLTHESAGFRLRVETAGPDRCHVVISSEGLERRQLSKEMLDHAISQVALGIAADGSERVANVSMIRRLQGAAEQPELRVSLGFPDGFGLSALRLRLADGVLLQSYPFSFRDLQLP